VRVSVLQLYFGIELCSILWSSILCNSVDRMLNADWLVVDATERRVWNESRNCTISAYAREYVLL